MRERVPDWVVRKADQIELVDSSPEQLRRRMLHGNIYPPEKVPQALTHFFRTDNLIALRELALRFLADETEEELLEYLRRHHIADAVGDDRADHGGGHRRPRDRRHRCAAPRAWRPGSRPISTSSTSSAIDGGVAGRTPSSSSRLRNLAADVGAQLARGAGATIPPRRIVDFARRAADHPDRGRLEPAQPLAGADGRRIHRAQGVIRKRALGIDVHIIATRPTAGSARSFGEASRA